MKSADLDMGNIWFDLGVISQKLGICLCHFQLLLLSAEPKLPKICKWYWCHIVQLVALDCGHYSDIQMTLKDVGVGKLLNFVGSCLVSKWLNIMFITALGPGCTVVWRVVCPPKRKKTLPIRWSKIWNFSGFSPQIIDLINIVTIKVCWHRTYGKFLEDRKFFSRNFGAKTGPNPTL